MRRGPVWLLVICAFLSVAQVTEPSDEVTAGPTVHIVADPDVGQTRQWPPSTVVDGLVTATVLTVEVEGFRMFDRAVAEQCEVDVGRRCDNRLPVQVDEYGRATFQYLVHADIGDQGQGCRADTTACFVTVRSRDGRRRGSIQTVFVDSLPPPAQLQVAPSRGLQAGDDVEVTITGMPPDARGVVTTCAAPASRDPQRCGGPAPAVEVTADSTGRATVTLPVTRGPVGTRQISCRDDQACGVALIGATAAIRAPVVPLRFGPLPGAEYDTRRLAVGLLAAVLLLGTAAWLVRTTDWSAVGEAAAPEIDEAEYADLDAMVAAMPDDTESADATSGSV